MAKGEPGAAAISVGKRTAAPRRKAGKKGVKEGAGEVVLEDVEVDEDGVPVDPNEPRYCVCNGVSFGEMIACENNQVCGLRPLFCLFWWCWWCGRGAN